MAYEPLREHRPTNFSVPLGSKRPGSPLRHSFTPTTEPTVFEDVFIPLDDDLPAKYKSPEMRKASVSVRRRISQLEPVHNMQKPARNLVAWIPEVSWLLVSILCLTAIIVILRRFDGEPPPRWIGGLSLNALLAYFVSIAQFAHTVPVLQCLGQLRWLRYSGGSHRLLNEFDAIDQAARGSFGAFLLIFRLRGGILGILGASIVTQGIITSAATQAAIEYRNELTVEPGANQTGAHIVVHWGWLSVLVAQIVLSTGLLVAVAVWTQRQDVPVLKTSTLATLVALDEDAKMFLSNANGQEGLQDWSKKINMTLEKGDQGLGVSLAAVKDGAFATLSFTEGLTGIRKRRAEKRHGVYFGSASAPVSPR